MTQERVQRRLAAILAADVVGYSRLTEADEEGTLARLRSLRNELTDPTIAKYGGRTVKLMGDGALFGARLISKRAWPSAILPCRRSSALNSGSG